MKALQFLTTLFLMVAHLPAYSQSSSPAPEQQLPTLSAEDDATNQALDNLVKLAPLLPYKKVALSVVGPLGIVSAAAGDKNGHIHILHRPKTGDPILVVDRSGKLLRSWGSGMYKIPHSIHLDPQGNVWTTDAGTSAVTKYDPAGTKLLEIHVGDIPDGDRPFCSVTGVAFKQNGNILVSDGYCNARIVEFSAEGQRITAWGKKGRAPGEFNLPHDIAVGPDDIIYVADRENGRVQWFDQNAGFLGEKVFGGRVYSIAIDRSGFLYVGAGAKLARTPEVNANIFKFNPKTGVVEGRIPVMSHQTEIDEDGTIYPGSAHFEQGADKHAPLVVIFQQQE